MSFFMRMSYTIFSNNNMLQTTYSTFYVAFYNSVYARFTLLLSSLQQQQLHKQKSAHSYLLQIEMMSCALYPVNCFQLLQLIFRD